jgi:MscS family membrane protein
MRRLAAALSVATCLAAGAPAHAQLPGLAGRAARSQASAQASDPSGAPENAAEAGDSPRASAREFVELVARRGDYAAATRYLVLPSGEEQRGPELARRLRGVLERHLQVDLDALSPDSQGDVRDGLPTGVDRIGHIPNARGGEDPVFLVRIQSQDGARWAFSRQTVARVDEWYDALPDRWIRDRIPQGLQRHGPLSVMWWQWLALPVLAGLALAAGRLVSLAMSRALRRLLRRTPTRWDDLLLAQTSAAVTLLFSVGFGALLLPLLGLRPGAYAGARSVLAGFATVAVFWVLWRAVDVWAHFLEERSWAANNPSARSLLAATRNLLRVFVAVTGLVATLAALGYPVATVLAGLGIGGIAIAFGAQKTIENLFGSISLAADQPFRVGDFVKIEDVVTGNVERIGMRSTQVRTLDRTLVSIPNGKLAEMRIESFGPRDRIRLACTLGLVHETSDAQLRAIVAGIEKLLREHPRIWPDTITVRLAAIGAHSLDVEIVSWFATSEWPVFLECRQEALLGFRRIVEAQGSAFAYPTRTVHVVDPAHAPGAPSAERAD